MLNKRRCGQSKPCLLLSLSITPRDLPNKPLTSNSTLSEPSNFCATAVRKRTNYSRGTSTQQQGTRSSGTSVTVAALNATHRGQSVTKYAAEGAEALLLYEGERSATREKDKVPAARAATVGALVRSPHACPQHPTSKRIERNMN